MPTPVGFLGFGEAGFHLARGLRSVGAPPLLAFDINARHGAAGQRIRSRADATTTRLVDTPQALAQGASLILSVVTAASAVEAAASIAGHLTENQLYADLNSVSPETKRQIADVITSGAGRFVEVAVMAPIPGPAHRVPMLLNGPSAPAFAEALSPYQMRFDIMDATIGAAAAVKMCRSIVIKGMEALLLECTLAARRYDATARVFESFGDTYPGIDWQQVAEYMIGRVREHGARRAREMEEVAATLRAAGVEPVTAEATAHRQDWEATLRRSLRLSGVGPATNDALLQLLVAPDPSAARPQAQ